MNRKSRRAEKTQAKTPARALGQVQVIFAAAFQHHQANRLEDAEPLYQQVLALDPRHADSLHLLGLLNHQTERHTAAIAMIGQAIAINPRITVYHSNLGAVLKDQGRIEEAVLCSRRAIALFPDHAEAHNNLGAALAMRGLRKEAVAAYRRACALKPDFPEAHNNLGVVLREQGQLEAAASCYRQAILHRLDYAEAHGNLGNALAEQDQPEAAIACYREAIRLQPDHADAYTNLGNVLSGQGLLDEAIAAHTKALQLGPVFALAYNNLGEALRRQGRLEEAIACYRRCIDLAPYDADAYSNLGNALAEQDLLDEAIALHAKAIQLKPAFSTAHSNMGTVLERQGRLDEAIACYRHCIALNPHNADGHNNLAMALLAQGDMDAGWNEMEWRWKTPGCRRAWRDLAQPQWRGEPAEGRVLLLHTEQGFGDTLQFCRYAAMAAARGLVVVMEVPRPLVRLLGRLAGVHRVVACGEALPPFDLHCPMMSMPLALNTTPATIPSAPAYVYADEKQAAIWDLRLAADDGGMPRVGLAWAGNPTLLANRRRSLALGQLAPLLAVPGLRFFSLQQGADALSGYPIADFMHEMSDFADTAAFIASLDLVISVDTAVAHLAAALGKPVWLLNRFDSDWRWYTGERDSLWYPTMRLYRQSRPGDWDTVLRDVVQDLHDLPRARGLLQAAE
jgi:tetratricopeptide (TPR) repeat protein